MITYTAQDIINRSFQLADLENSDFISYSEKIAILNEAYTKLYQKLINLGDNNFVRIINTNNAEIELPPDFWQLKSVTLNNSGFLTQVLRRPANQTLNYLSYDLMNNTLVINGNRMGATVTVEYYPVPTTLTFPNKPKVLPASNIVDMHKHYYITADTTNDVYKLYDTEDSSIEITVNVPPSVYTRVHMEDDYITFMTSVGSVYFNLMTGESTTVTDNSYVPAYYRGKTFRYKASKLYFVDANIVAYDEVTTVVQTGLKAIIYSEDFSNYIALKLDGTVYSKSGAIDLKRSITKIHSHGNDTVVCVSGTPYIATVDTDGTILSETLKDYAIVSVTDFDDDTGYGMLTKQLGGKNTLISYMDNTVLDFPNNMYFTMLAYLLALSFKTKQGSDTTQLAAMATAAEDEFSDTLTKDDWGTVRITNMY